MLEYSGPAVVYSSLDRVGSSLDRLSWVNWLCFYAGVSGFGIGKLVILGADTWVFLC